MPLHHKVTFEAKVQNLKVAYFFSQSCSITFKSSSSPLLSCKHDCLIFFVIFNHRNKSGTNLFLWSWKRRKGHGHGYVPFTQFSSQALMRLGFNGQLTYGLIKLYVFGEDYSVKGLLKHIPLFFLSYAWRCNQVKNQVRANATKKQRKM